MKDATHHHEATGCTLRVAQHGLPGGTWHQAFVDHWRLTIEASNGDEVYQDRIEPLDPKEWEDWEHYLTEEADNLIEEHVPTWLEVMPDLLIDEIGVPYRPPSLLHPGRPVMVSDHDDDGEAYGQPALDVPQGFAYALRNAPAGAGSRLLYESGGPGTRLRLSDLFARHWANETTDEDRMRVARFFAEVSRG